MVTWIPSIYTLYVSIYTSTMDPMGNYFFLLRGFPSNKQPPTATVYFEIRLCSQSHVSTWLIFPAVPKQFL